MSATEVRRVVGTRLSRAKSLTGVLLDTVQWNKGAHVLIYHEFGLNFCSLYFNTVGFSFNTCILFSAFENVILTREKQTPRYGEQSDGCQMGGGLWGWVTIEKGLRCTNCKL